MQRRRRQSRRRRSTPREPWRRRARAQRCSTAATSIAPPRRGRASASPSSPSRSATPSSPARLVHVRRRARQPARCGAPRAGRGRDRAARHPRPQRRDPRHRRADALAVRRAAPASSTSTRRSNCSPRCCPISTPPKLRERLVLEARLRLAQARDHAEAAAARSIGSAFPASASCTENKRVYPNGAEVSHVIGHVNIDNQGIAGIEKWLDGHGLADLHMAGLATDRLQKPVELAVDLRVQHALRDELVAARDEVQGDGRRRHRARRAHRRDRLHGVGARTTIPTIRARRSIRPASTGSPPASTRWARPSRRSPSRWRSTPARSTLKSAFDARMPLHYGKFTIHDYPRPEPHADACRRSSPIRRTSAPRGWRWRSASSTTRRSCSKLGQLDRLRTELPESAEPIVPKRWGELNTVTIAFGHGLSVAPLQAVMGDRRAGEWRHADPADLPEAHARRRRRRSPSA